MAIKQFLRGLTSPIPLTLLLVGLLAGGLLYCPQKPVHESCASVAIRKRDEPLLRVLFPEENVRHLLLRAYRVDVTVPGPPTNTDLSSPWLTINLHVHGSKVSGVELMTVIVPRNACSPL